MTYVLGTFLIALCLTNTATNVPFPTTPMMKISAKIKGTMYVSGRSMYGWKGSELFSSELFTIDTLNSSIVHSTCKKETIFLGFRS